MKNQNIHIEKGILALTGKKRKIVIAMYLKFMENVFKCVPQILAAFGDVFKGWNKC